MRFEFHVSRASRDRYAFARSLFQTDGNVVFANYTAAREFAAKINAGRPPESHLRPGHLNAMGLIDEILHLISEQYRKQVNPAALRNALAYLDSRLNQDEVENAIEAFCQQFPPAAVYRGETTLNEWLVDSTDGMSNREHAFEEMVLLYLANHNPAFAPFKAELFDDTALAKDTLYLDMMSRTREFFATQPTYGPDDQPLIELLETPAKTAPLSASEQLRFITQRWSNLIGDLKIRALNSLDFVSEEDRAIWAIYNPPQNFGGGGPISVVPVFTAEGMAAQERQLGLSPAGAGADEASQHAAIAAMFAEPEAFTQDTDWMPNTVMIAKSAYVWLDQLSKKYGREIKHLDQIPDEELDQLARWNINALWLIGVWERSKASERIKKIMGNPEAAASAYSLMAYRIADDLGGEAALSNLRERAKKRGIRLGSDMVPNHMGIDSEWTAEHPEWFLSLPESPYPNYKFNGENLSNDSRAVVQIEDGYWNRSDAAVAFKHIDTRNGSVRYIYHGNDGTGLPWNDTAQLNYLDPAVREQVIRTIVDVARRFPIIRFDAAMTLAKRHIERLWFPVPGSGTGIPSRAGRGLTVEEFNRAMPKEFWREVVDRCAAEAPDTLLLAEAFWLMEGFFVRTLGMHRVYNSAFMVMLRDEQNAGYRSVIKNTIEFDTRVINRYVNFLNNPDEKTAVDQFGKGDKYFGVCTMMATLPGLPMFGHGQIEGFSEKYGMEYRRAYYTEVPDQDLIRRHEREIFPLLKKRYVFADSKNFLLYDFYRGDGSVDENVFAYSNAYKNERGLMLFNNSYTETQGTINMSAAFSTKAPDLADDMSEEERARAKGASLMQRPLGEGLGLTYDDAHYVIFRDLVRDLEYIRPSKEIHERGLWIKLYAYDRYVFVNFREVVSTAANNYARLCAELHGEGVPNMDEALADFAMQDVMGPYRALVNGDIFHRMTEARIIENDGAVETALLDEIDGKYRVWLQAAAQKAGVQVDEAEISRDIKDIRRKTNAALHLGLSGILANDEQFRDQDWAGINAWLFTHGLGKATGETPAKARARIDEWRLDKVMKATFRGQYMDEYWADQNVALVKILTTHQNWWHPVVAAGLVLQPFEPPHVLEKLLSDHDVKTFIKIHTFDGVTYFNKENFERLLTRLFLIATLQIGANDEIKPAEVVRRVNACHAVVDTLRRAGEASKFELEKLEKAVQPTVKPLA